MRIHTVPPAESHSGDTLLATQFTQRAVNRDYRIETGKYSDSQLPPELDGSTKASKIPPMMTFDNFYGHFCYRDVTDENNKMVGKELFTRVFDVTKHPNATAWHRYITMMCIKSINKNSVVEKDRYCWDLQNVEEVEFSKAIKKSSLYPDTYKQYLLSQKRSLNSPLSVHTVQAWIESSNKRGKDKALFKMVSVSTTMTSISGGINNNLTIEMGFDEKEGTKDMEKRMFDKSILGTVCIGSTPHNADAGKVRRLRSYSRARVLSSDPLWSVEHVTEDLDTDGDWCVHCMGSVFATTEKSVILLVKSMKEGLRRYYSSQFDYKKHFYLPVPPSFIVYHKTKVLDISIAPGVVVFGTEKGDMGDSCMISLQKPGGIVSALEMTFEGPNSTANMYNPYYLFFTFPNEDQQPRLAFANAQTTQCQGLPWGPANARISPNHVSNPLLGTKFGRMVEVDQLENDDAIWDVLPGEDVVICFMSMPGNYEDAILVSQKFADMGGFSNMSVVPVRLRERDTMPEVGERLCGKKHKWWKVDCTSSCICNTKRTSNNHITVGRIATGIVDSIKRTEDGGISIHVLSFSQLTDGDKLGSLHGQKGLVNIIPHLDCPVLYMKEGYSMTADVYMSPASVIARQTLGMIYESGAAWRAAKDGRCGMDAIYDITDIDTEECEYIMYPETGKPITRRSADGKTLELAKATVGMVRLIAQTQTTREKHHLTHASESKHSLTVVPGRGAGGGISRAEMDAHVGYGNGLIGPLQELCLRENTIIDYVCTQCFRIADICECGTDRYWEQTCIRNGLQEFDVISACLNGSSNIYKL